MIFKIKTGEHKTVQAVSSNTPVRLVGRLYLARKRKPVGELRMKNGSGMGACILMGFRKRSFGNSIRAIQRRKLITMLLPVAFPSTARICCARRQVDAGRSAP